LGYIFSVLIISQNPKRGVVNIIFEEIEKLLERGDIAIFALFYQVSVYFPCYTLSFLIPLISFNQTFLSKRKIWFSFTMLDFKIRIW